MKFNITNVATLLSAMQNRKVLVLGDVMLDRFIDGAVTRISPEASGEMRVTAPSMNLSSITSPRTRTFLFCMALSKVATLVILNFIRMAYLQVVHGVLPFNSFH